MMRWRTRGLIGVETSDGRTLTGTVTHEPTVPLRLVRKPSKRAVTIGEVEVRIVGNEIQARLPWSYRHANLDTWPRRTLPCEKPGGDALGIHIALEDAEVMGLTAARGATNPWGL